MYFWTNINIAITQKVIHCVIQPLHTAALCTDTLTTFSPTAVSLPSKEELHPWRYSSTLTSQQGRRVRSPPSATTAPHREPRAVHRAPRIAGPAPGPAPPHARSPRQGHRRPPRHSPGPRSPQAPPAASGARGPRRAADPATALLPLCPRGGGRYLHDPSGRRHLAAHGDPRPALHRPPEGQRRAPPRRVGRATRAGGAAGRWAGRPREGRLRPLKNQIRRNRRNSALFGSLHADRFSGSNAG